MSRRCFLPRRVAIQQVRNWYDDAQGDKASQKADVIFSLGLGPTSIRWTS